MAYENILGTEDRGMYSPPDGGAPQILPDYWRNSPEEEPRTDLPNLTDEELNALGWKGPIQMPPLENTSSYTHEYEWNEEIREYTAIELDEFEKLRRIDYGQFWELLLYTNAYSLIKLEAENSLKINTLTTEFIALISDAKNGRANVEKIQESLTEIIANIPFTQENLQEIQGILTVSGMIYTYSI